MLRRLFRRNRTRPPDLYDMARQFAPGAIVMAGRYGPVFECPDCGHREVLPHRMNRHMLEAGHVPPTTT
ncbi:hypothetical protein SEA_REYNAULD_90 [Rhodococcus phage Reynauld]|uniref:Uncharacterized protein n=1 Tax=Rhodococcus phage Reynauld TaxID=3062845 RepID=A0ACD4UIB2_9CAUD|nr:hypothetical protein SEA_REYNAULD_90 [Rhodococcus phage Reynauld]